MADLERAAIMVLGTLCVALVGFEVAKAAQNIRQPRVIGPQATMKHLRRPDVRFLTVLWPQKNIRRGKGGFQS